MKRLVTSIIAIVFSVSLVNASPNGDAKNETKQDDQVIHIVEIKNLNFVPKTINASKGDKIVWINKDIFPHNIVDSGSQETLSDTLAKDDEFSYIIDKDINYECGFHPSMTGTINISSH